ncbi:hypothetical protein B0H19DRAFT_1172654 [Mycena capillaripes]|nr:hypothetical protein B0H19DRAFT_1172654 [Mycena capillaripes]
MSGRDVFDPQQLYDDVAYTSRVHNDDSHSALTPTTRSGDVLSSSKGDLKDAGTSNSSATLASVPRWTPKLLRLLPICIFALVLLLLIIGLELFYRHSPYNAPSKSGTFMWTYAPVALLMIVQWVWKAYDLQVKILVPWAAMSRGPVPARESWLLDYIGGNSLVTLWTACRYGHIVVLLTTLGLWSTALAGIVTTSLFTIQDNVYTTSTTFNLTTTLDRSLLTDFDPAILSDKNYLNSYLGRQLLNLSRSQWTTADGIVIEAFGDSSAVASESMISQTLGYSGRLDCKKATASYGGNQTIQSNVVGFPDGVAWFVDVNAAGCEVKYRLTDSNEFLLCSGDPCYYGRLYNHTCPGSSSYTTALVLAAIHNFTYVSASAVECSPSYSQYHLDVSVSSSSSAPVAASILSHSQDLSMISGWRGMLQWINTTEGVQRGHTVSTSLEGDLFGAWGNTAIAQTSCDCDPWFFLIGHTLNVSAPELMNTGTLMNASSTTFPGVFSDIVQSLLMTPAPSSAAPLPGNIQYTTRQLVASQTSVRIAQAALSVLLATVVGVYFLRPQANLPLNPSSMAAQAFLLKSDHDKISAIIKDTVTITTAETRVLLDDWSFSIHNEKEFQIRTERHGSLSPVPPKFVKAPVWRPPILHPVFKASLCLIVIGTIIALELALRKSQHDGGFANFVPSSRQGWTYVAPAYLFLLGLLLSSYTFSVSTLEPFFAMHRAPQPARQSVRYSPATKTNAGLAWHAFRYRSVVGVSCSLIILMVPFLKIVVSGLITTASEPAQESVVLTPTTTFNMTSILPPVQTLSNVELPGEILALSQIEKYQLPLPPWTTAAGAVAQLDSSRLGQIVHAAQNTTIALPLEVMRADLEACNAATGSGLVMLSTNVLRLPTPKDSSCKEESVTLTFPLTPGGWFGQVYALGSCAGYAFVYGNTDSTNATRINDMTVVQCTSLSLSRAIQNVTLAFEQDTDVKIVSIDNSVFYNQSFMSSFPAESKVDFASILPEPTFQTNSSLSFDTFFQIMTLKNTSTPLAAFLDPANFTAAAQSLYSTYWAVHASIYERIPILDLDATDQHPLEAVLNYRITRIVQAEVPTRIMQALLAFILACWLVTAVIVRKTNNVLTKPPYSIAATMGLLADSAFVELSELRGVRNAADLDRVLEPYEFQLGWGNNPKGGMRFGVDVVAK